MQRVGEHLDLLLGVRLHREPDHQRLEDRLGVDEDPRGWPRIAQG